MQFASSRTPTLTPLGQRLLALSRAKLQSLDAPAGARDPTDGLRRGVLVREAIRSAWASLETPSAHSELTSWHAPSLDVLSEEDEDNYDDDIAEERWLEDVLADVDEDDDEPSADFTVGLPVYEDYEFEATESYTISYAQAGHVSHGTDVTVVAVGDDETDDEDMVEEWLELDAHVHVHDQKDLELAEELEVMSESMSVDVAAAMAESGAFTPEMIAKSAVPALSRSTPNSPPSDFEEELLLTPPGTPPRHTDLTYALAVLSTYALPPADLLPKLETKPKGDECPERPSPRLRSLPCLRASVVAGPPEEEEVECDEECNCDALGLVCDGDCLPPPLADLEDEDEGDECRTPPLVALDCGELEVASGFSTFDWKAAERIDRIGKKLGEEAFGDRFSGVALGLTLEA